MLNACARNKEIWLLEKVIIVKQFKTNFMKREKCLAEFCFY